MAVNTNWQHLYNVSPGYFFSFSYEGVLLMMNDTMLSQLGYESSEVINKRKFIDILNVGGKIFYQTHFFPLVKLHGEYQEVFVTLVSKSGEEIPILINVKMDGVFPDAQIHCGGVRITKRNKYEREIIEARKAAEKAQEENETLIQLQKEFEKNQVILEKRLQKLNRQNNEQQQINSILSHELQEPIRKIGVFSKLLLDEIGASGSDRWRGFLSKINNSSESMREMMLSIQKYLSLQETKFKPETVSLEKPFKEAHEKALVLFADFKVNLIKDNLPELYCDPAMISRLFYELLSNSAKFCDRGKDALEIRIEIEKVEENIFTEMEDRYRYEEFFRITYSDNGIGFSNKFNKEIFALFRKAHVYGEGLGFGLAYCKKVVDLHHGYISASAEIGIGAKFTILLPASIPG